MSATVPFSETRILAVCLYLAISIRIVNAQWEGSPQWEKSIYQAQEELLRRSSRAARFYYDDCPDSPGNVEPPEHCASDEKWGPCGCYEPPYWPFDPIKINVDVGFVIGRSMEIWGGQYPKYINIFLGVPYARTIYHERRFKPPEDPQHGWEQGIQEWRADYYRDACPQELWHYQDEFVEQRNFSENCLHMNIFMPNFTGKTGPNQNKSYEVMVFIHGKDYASGDAMMYPGHILARKEVVVVTFNYRLGALGFLSTMDTHSPGNYGLMDIIQVLKWIKKYISRFHGDPRQVTLVGHGSGASAISLLLLTPYSMHSGQPLFHQVILMSGTDLCEWSFVDTQYITYWDRSDPLEFAKDLGRNVGCDPDHGSFDTERLVQCLRSKHFDEIVNGTAGISKKYGMMWGPFGPTVDGDVIPNRPREMRQAGQFMKVPIIAGLCKEAGAELAENASRSVVGVRMSDGLEPAAFRQILENIIKPRLAIRNQDEVVGAMEFEYTFWAKPDNKTAVRQNLIDLYTDWVWGSCIDHLLKTHMAHDPPVYFYVFAHRSEFEYMPSWMGAIHGRDVDYVFGHPFYNDTLRNLTNVMPDQQTWTIVDRNISEWMQEMWVNFTKYGVPTTWWRRNVTWYPMRQYNLSYLHIADWSYMDINYRQSHYAFWREYFPSLSSLVPLTTTPFPTPEPLIQYQVATYSLVAVAIITIFIMAALGITLWRKSSVSL